MIYTYEGWLALHAAGEAYDILYMSNVRQPLAKELHNLFGWGQRQVSVRYIIADKAITEEERLDAEIRQAVGEGKVRWGARYSELTGYLWTDEEVRIGGHDLIEELKDHVGKWCWLEVKVHEHEWTLGNRCGKCGIWHPIRYLKNLWRDLI